MNCYISGDHTSNLQCLVLCRVMNKLVAFSALLVATVTAYNFEDPDFNAILADDFEELSDDYVSLSHPRYRRDEDAVKERERCHHHRRKGEFCCAEEIMAKLRGSDKDLKKACFKEIIGKDKDHEKHDPFSCKSMEQRKEKFVCIMECIGQKMDFLDSEGNLKEEEFESFIKESFSSESWLASLQDKVISTCLAEAKNATANRDASDSESCNPAGLKISHCLYREIQLNCPAEQIKDEKSCARIQERIKNHDFFQPPPPPPPGEIEELDN